MATPQGRRLGYHPPTRASLKPRTSGFSTLRIDHYATRRALFVEWIICDNLSLRAGAGPDSEAARQRHGARPTGQRTCQWTGATPAVTIPAHCLARQWGEYCDVSGGSPDPDLQLLALRLFQALLRVDGDFQLQPPVWVSRDQNVSTDFLSRASESRLHDFRLHPHIFTRLDRRWGQHTIDRFACAATCQRLSAPFAGCFCSEYFQPRCGVD